MSINKDMMAIRFHEYGSKEVLRIDYIPIPQPGINEVLLKVRACGVNRADLLSRNGQIRGKGELPHIPGTEVAAEVASVGHNVTEYKPGDKVMVTPLLYCGKCEACRLGEDNLCSNGNVFGFDTNGGYAEYVTAPADYLIKLPTNVSYESAAAMAATASTSWHMLVERASIKAGEMVLIVAAGSGIGVYALQIARYMGARVIATAGSQEKQKKAKELGAEVVIDHSEQGWYKQVREITGGRGVDIVFEHVGKATWNDSIRSLSRMGRLVTCGAFTGSKVEIDLWPLFSKQLKLIGSFSANRTDYEKILELAGQKVIKPILHTKLPIEMAREAHRMLEEREVFGTIVLIPNQNRR
ncbi:zinc-binding dehydrogenase [Alteribacillus sp. YIM 98480]|uniref:zinc-binding dehydrogenase n=1 Tax=Alteribacillus sp. YIM 98480 TaxID=2606599 RepID=UPI0018EED8EC|nr:zinc-binding dehydrogenase [Alteribacillus sp. YIM 98480]